MSTTDPVAESEAQDGSLALTFRRPAMFSDGTHDTEIHRTVPFADPTFRFHTIQDGCIRLVFTDHTEVYPLSSVIEMWIDKNSGDSFYPVRVNALRERGHPDEFSLHLINQVSDLIRQALVGDSSRYDTAGQILALIESRLNLGGDDGSRDRDRPANPPTPPLAG